MSLTLLNIFEIKLLKNFLQAPDIGFLYKNKKNSPRIQNTSF